MSDNQMPQPEPATEGSKTPVQTHTPSPQEAAVEPSGYRGTNPATAGPGQTAVRSQTPENADGHIDPSAPNSVMITPHSDDTK